METIIIRKASRSKMEALYAFMQALKIDFASGAKEPAAKTNKQEPAVISNPELIRRIEEYQQGKTEMIPMTVQELRERYGS